MTIRRTIGAVALAAVAAAGYGDDAVVCDGAERTVDGLGEIAQVALDLSEKFVVTSFSPMSVPYSAVGWGIEENGAVGWSVTLELTQVGDAVSSVVASGLAGRGTNSWNTGNLRNGDYVLRHSVKKSGVEEPIETLEAYLVFDRSAARPLETLAEVAEAVFPDAGRPCAVTAMGGVNWTAVGFAGDGIAGPASGTATLTFEADGIGSFAFEYLCAAGETLTVAVDDGEPQTLAAAEGWTEARFAFGDACAHAVVVSAAGAGTAVRGVRWDTGRSSVGAIVEGALDLSEVWDKRDLGDEPILWSSLGWEDAAEAESGKTVTLQLIPLSAGGAQTLESGLTGHLQVFDWTPGKVTKQVYDIRHTVVGGSPLETDLDAYFSFENYDQVEPAEPDVRAAIRPGDDEGCNFGIVNDAENWWRLAGGPGEGLAAPRGESTLVFTVDWRGTFFFDHLLSGGTWTVKVDGAVVRTLDAAADWTGVELPVDGNLVTHVIEFATELSNGGFAGIRNVRWVEADDRFADGRVGVGAVDLREGVLVVRRERELMPFAWSSTNFTGNAFEKDAGFVSIDPQSVASVRVVQVTGAGDDVSQWATEVAGTSKTLVSERQGEDAVKWKGAKPGVWKAELVLEAGGSETYRETRILDLRKYTGQGLVILVK